MNPLEIENANVLKKKQIKDILGKNPNHSQFSDKKKLDLDKFVNELFDDNMEIESWVSAKENIL